MNYSNFVLVFIVLAIFGSCVSTSFDSANSSSWKAREKEKAKGTVRIVSVSAEKSGEWGTLEREVKELVPLYFSEKAYVTVSSTAEADYAAEVRVREREYPKGWKTNHSLSVEVRLWAGEDEGLPLPMTAGRAQSQGKKSFSSSKTLSVMLRRAVKNAVRKLPSKKRNLVSGQEG